MTAWDGWVTRSFLALALSGLAEAGTAQVPPEEQFVEALQLLPDRARPGATLIRQLSDHEEVVREGSNPYVCVSDLDGDDEFLVTCYHESLHSLLARRRELLRRGEAEDDVRRILDVEVESGELILPERAHQVTMSGPMDPGSGRPTSLGVLHFFYIPFATEEEVGLVAREGDGAWLARAGWFDAHIRWDAPPRRFGRED